jgi:hypothetical protein
VAETRKLAAILVQDVAGYSRLAGADEDRTLARLRTLRSDLIDRTLGGSTRARAATISLLMHNFQHKHASGCWIEYEPSIGGRGLVARRMIVESSIPFDHEEPGFDLHAATELQREAEAYAKAKHLRTLIFVRKY